MCILIAKPAYVAMPSIDTLENCYFNNHHGCGVALPGQTPFHTLDFDEFVAYLSQVDPDLPMILHFRLATHGSINTDNCHPFRNDSIGVSFAHNGILDIEPIGDKTDSETAFITLYAPAIAEDKGIFGDALRKAVRRSIGCSKFAFLDDNGALHTFGHFVKDHGVYYSNNTYRYSRYKTLKIG